MSLETLIEKFGAFVTWLISSSVFFSRYVLFAGVAYLVFYVWKRKNFLHKKIQATVPLPKEIRHDVLYSILTAAIFGAIGFLVLWMNQHGLTKMYKGAATYGYGYLGLSFLVMIIFHDTYFYWTHKLMHHRRLFKLVHHTHHRSHNPTPWAAFAFHPLEALIEFGVVPLAVILFPLNGIVLISWSLWMITWNVVGHLGYELFPKGFVRHPLFKWLNTSTHHNLHHERSRGNYGLYFNVWDRIMKTNDPGYEMRFDEVKRRGL